MKLGTETGSLVNHVASQSSQEPVVGMGATMLGWSDRHAATIVKVTPSQIHVQQDIATRTDSNGASEIQTYTYAPNPEAPVIVFRKTKKGYKAKSQGYGLWIGTRNEYYDFNH